MSESVVQDSLQVRSLGVTEGKPTCRARFTGAFPGSYRRETHLQGAVYRCVPCTIAGEVARSGILEPGCFTKYHEVPGALMGLCARAGVLKCGRVVQARDPSS